MRELTAFQRDLLIVVAGMEAPNGLEISDELNDYYTDGINHGRLYPNLDTLAEMGLLEKGEKDQRTNEYLITDEGMEEIAAHRNWRSEYL